MRGLVGCVVLLFLISCAIAQPPGTILLDSYAGADDDAKLTAALDAAKGATYIPAVVFSARKYTFTQTRTTFSGLKLIGPATGVAEVTVNVGTGTSSWWVAPTTATNIYNIYFSNIVFYSTNGNTQFWHHPYTLKSIYACQFDSLQFYGWKHIFGNPSASCAFTQIHLSGNWVLQGTDTQLTVGGSDNELWTSGSLQIRGQVAGGGKPLLILTSIGKTNVGKNVNIIADNGWYGLKVMGSADLLGLTIYGSSISGGNSTSNGALVIQTGGNAIFRDVRLSSGMVNPSAQGHSPADQGIVMHTGGQALWTGCTYDRASTVAQSVPFLWGNAGTVRVRNIKQGQGSWTALPVVKNGGSLTLSADNSVLTQ